MQSRWEDMDILKKIQNLPEQNRKVILWAIVILLGFAFALAWVQGLKQRLGKAKEKRVWEEFQPSQFEEQLKGLPQIEIPELPELTEEELKELEEEIRKAEQQQ